MSTQWDNKETFGEWILKEVYFEDGWPSVMRDPVQLKQEPVGKFAKFNDGIWREVTKGSNGVFLYEREEK
jgi:hypothetical protein